MSTERSQWGSPRPMLEESPSRPVTKYNLGDLSFAALGDRVIVLEDQFKSGYECETCNGVGTVPSTVTGGKAKTCPTCDGRGGLLVVPDASVRRPTTGKIVSAGEKCRVLAEGESVMYSNFAGHAVDLDRAGHKLCLRILHETEVLCRVEGHIELRTLRGQKEVTSI